MQLTLSKALINLVAFMGLISTNIAIAEEKHNHHIHQHKKVSTISEQIIDLMHKPMMQIPFLESDNLDLNFISNMIPHHQGAIDASKQILQYTQNEQIKTIAKHIIQTQEKEIETFKTILKNMR